ncbi:unnamed protein product [Amaranthus hypochondriacus]
MEGGSLRTVLVLLSDQVLSFPLISATFHQDSRLLSEAVQSHAVVDSNRDSDNHGSQEVFIPEQKLYSRAQLRQHITCGDLELDGKGCGFTGHPLCEFCKDHSMRHSALEHGGKTSRCKRKIALQVSLKLLFFDNHMPGLLSFDHKLYFCKWSC